MSIRSHVQVYSLYCHRTRALRNPQSSNGSPLRFTRYYNPKNANQTKKSTNNSSLQLRVPKCTGPLSGSLQAEIYALPHSKSRSVELSYFLSSFGFQPCNDNYLSHRTIVVRITPTATSQSLYCNFQPSKRKRQRTRIANRSHFYNLYGPRALIFLRDQA